MPAGRPRQFDYDTALDQALQVFWRNGYEGASLPELTAAMGINRPSLYAAFGNKEQLFLKAIDRYLDEYACHVTRALEQPTARQVVETLLHGGVELVSNRRSPHGCFMVQGALACGDDAKNVRDAMARRRAAGESALKARLQRAIDEGDLPKTSSAADLARYVMSMAHGLAVNATSGATRAELKRVADLVLNTWPPGN